MEHPIRNFRPADDRGDEPQSKSSKRESESVENDFDSGGGSAHSRTVETVPHGEHECKRSFEKLQSESNDIQQVKSGETLTEKSLHCLAELMSFDQLSEPLVFTNAISDWPAANWTPSSLIDLLHGKELKFRVGSQFATDRIQWESDCHHVTATVTDFHTWLDQSPTSRDHVTSLSAFNKTSHWLYSDYTHMKELFDESILKKAVNWSNFGLSKTGTESTFWLGSEGAYTPCHYDTYGYNLVAQIYGRKRWRLFPPEASRDLYPSRIPYEESSVYSQVHVQRPDDVTHPLFKVARCYDVTLRPGEVLYVPRHWWHFVESLETTISVNCWVDTPLDDESRFHESITRLLMCGMMTSLEDHVETTWLNPTEECTSATVNLAYLSATLTNLDSTREGQNTEKESKTGCCYDNMNSADRTENSDVAMATGDRCRCRACDICRELLELNPDAMTVRHIVATTPSGKPVDDERGVTMATDSLSLSDVMSCVTKPDVIELIGEHLKELVRSKSNSSEEKNIETPVVTSR